MKKQISDGFMTGGCIPPHATAEREGFEPPVHVSTHLISNQAPSSSSATSPGTELSTKSSNSQVVFGKMAFIVQQARTRFIPLQACIPDCRAF